MDNRRLRVAFALLLVVATTHPAAYACHAPVQAEFLSAQQESLAAYGHGSREFIAYSLEQTTSCSNGFADIFPCENVDLLAHLPLADIGGGTGNDIWGWRDGNNEYALVGRSNGTAFVDMTDPENPVYLGNLATATNASPWRDVKVYDNHAFIVADSAGGHGMQIFDLTQLRSVPSPPVEFEATARYTDFGSAHNVVINEETGFAYAVGSNTCNGGLHMVDIRNPTSPSFAGCFDQDGYTHDAQCVVYQGPDRDFRGVEVCFASNEDTITIVDVSDKASPVQLSRTPYEGSAYTHQGWLTEDHAFFIVDDELDEQRNNHNARTYIWDMSDLRNPSLSGTHTSKRTSIDHNQYVVGDHTYQANYQQGLTILEIVDPGNGVLREVGSFDSYPESNRADFDGAWSVYPYLKSGAVLIGDINRGLLIVRPTLGSGLFSDSFETGDLSSWSKVKGPGVAIIEPGLKRSGFALEVTVDGTDTVSQVSALQPARETSLELSFRLKANRVDLGGDSVEIARLVNPKKKTVASLVLRQQGSRYEVELLSETGGALEGIGSTPIPKNRTILLRLEWQQASSAGADDGVVRLVKKKRVRVERETLDTTMVVDSVRLGLPSGSQGTAGGTFLIDDIEIGQ